MCQLLEPSKFNLEISLSNRHSQLFSVPRLTSHASHYWKIRAPRSNGNRYPTFPEIFRLSIGEHWHRARKSVAPLFPDTNDSNFFQQMAFSGHAHFLAYFSIRDERNWLNRKSQTPFISAWRKPRICWNLACFFENLQCLKCWKKSKKKKPMIKPGKVAENKTRQLAKTEEMK